MRLTPRMLLASSALAAVVALVFAVLLIAIGSLREAGESARHAEQVVAQANRLERLVIDLQTGARGYIITRQERFLDPWKNAPRTYPREA